MKLIEVTIDEVKEFQKESDEKALLLLTDEDKQFIQDNFRVENFYESDTQYLCLFPFGNKDLMKRANRLVKIGIADYSDHFYTIYIDSLTNKFKQNKLNK